MATAKFYTTSKRHNSTYVPTSGTDVTVYLKDGSDLLTPTFKINHSGVPTWSMMLFEGRYYFITGIRSLRQDLWEIDAAVDVLSTYKSDITGSSQFVTYANVTNTEVIDDRLPPKTTATYSKNYVTLDAGLMTGQWTVAVTVAGFDSTATFLLTPAQAKDLVNATDFNNWFNSLWNAIQGEANSAESDVNSAISAGQSISAAAQAAGNDTDIFKQIAAGIADAGVEIVGSIGAYFKAIMSTLCKFLRLVISTPSAQDCIKSAMFLPWQVAGSGTAQQIYLGEYPTGITAIPMNDPIVKNNITIAIPWQASDWRRNAPYHHFYLYLPFMGDVELPASEMIGCSNIKVYFSLNVINGSLNYRVATDQDTTLGVYSCCCGVPYPIGSSNITPVSVGTALGGAAAAITGQPTLGAAAIAAASLSAIRPSISCVGGGGGGAGSGLDLRCILHSVFHDTVQAPSNPAQSVGVPVNARMALSGITGFVQTQNASVPGSMTDTERELINNLLNGGIFIE